MLQIGANRLIVGCWTGPYMLSNGFGTLRARVDLTLAPHRNGTFNSERVTTNVLLIPSDS